MEHTNFKPKSGDYRFITKDSDDVQVYKFTKEDGITLLRTITPTQIGDYYKIEDTTEDTDCFMFVKQNEYADIIRVGDPDVLVIAYYEPDLTLAYKQYDYDGEVVDEGDLVEIGEGFYYIEPATLDETFFESNDHLTPLSVPYNVVNVSDSSTSDTILPDKNFINVGYNMFGFLGNRNSYFDLANGNWVNDDDSTAKASDIAKAICAKYNLVWDDRNDSNWIGNYVKYIRTYLENEKRFKYYSPSITPESNSNNFDLVQTDEDGNYYVRGISVLLLQSLETINSTDGAIITFKGS